MAQNSIGMNELEFIDVLDIEDDLVQVLGVTPPEDGSEIEVASVEFDDGESFLIDIDYAPYKDANVQENIVGQNDEDFVDNCPAASNVDEI